jgi:hypothetical protein
MTITRISAVRGAQLCARVPNPKALRWSTQARLGFAAGRPAAGHNESRRLPDEGTQMTTLTEGLIAFVSPEGRDEAEPLRSQLPSALHDLLLQPAGSLSFSHTTELIGDQGLDGLAKSAPNLIAAEPLGLDASSFGARWAAIGVPVFTNVELEAFTDGWETVEDPELRDRLGGRGW